MFGRGCIKCMFSCKACNRSLTKESTRYDDIDTVDIASWTNFYYFGPHRQTIKPLPDVPTRGGSMMAIAIVCWSESSTADHEIPIAMPNMRFLGHSVMWVFSKFKNQSHSWIIYAEAWNIETGLMLLLAKWNWTRVLAPLVEELLMQNISDCVISLWNCHCSNHSTCITNGPSDDDEWVHEMLRTDKHLQSFNSYKLCIYLKPNFAGNDLQFIRLHPSSFIMWNWWRACPSTSMLQTSRHYG